ncbi:hypothetical protein J4Q44_G00211490 [Coregonus suidteri]|uniref:Vacuolar protein sorting-associated protein 13 DH-like domain-containing protein n=1 Tax=Coregonus suidteri TaxID=861788 RepID=A0AAN8QR99_9TELE
MDNRHQSEREYIRYHGTTNHLVAGNHGLAHGIIGGGLISIITSTVEGVKTEGGVSGFFSGLGKGLVGTVTKPVARALDFASETAQTVRDMSSLSNHRLCRSSSNWSDHLDLGLPLGRGQLGDGSLRTRAGSRGDRTVGVVRLSPGRRQGLVRLLLYCGVRDVVVPCDAQYVAEAFGVKSVQTTCEVQGEGP